MKDIGAAIEYDLGLAADVTPADYAQRPAKVKAAPRGPLSARPGPAALAGRWAYRA